MWSLPVGGEVSVGPASAQPQPYLIELSVEVALDDPLWVLSSDALPDRVEHEVVEVCIAHLWPHRITGGARPPVALECAEVDQHRALGRHSLAGALAAHPLNVASRRPGPLPPPALIRVVLGAGWHSAGAPDEKQKDHGPCGRLLHLCCDGKRCGPCCALRMSRAGREMPVSCIPIAR